jgi:hypothetical protein
MANRNRYPLQLPNTPSFFVNDNATQAEQEAVFSNPSSDTGIVAHGYSGSDAGVSGPNYQGAAIISAGTGLPLAKGLLANAKLLANRLSDQISSDLDTQSVKLAGGYNVLISRVNVATSSGSELVPNGYGSSPNLLLNMPSADGLHNGRPIWNYAAMEEVNTLPAYQGSHARLLDQLADIVESGEYDFFIVGLPVNNGDATIAWKDTFRTQCSIPEESLLVMILADVITISPVGIG